jgi:glycosyltransferase involved in cell wall biosynthesis
MMTRSPKITIVTPSFNRAWAIRSCIQSLQQQSVTDYEHLIIDGGSGDGTVKILQEVASVDSRVRFISEPDRGMYDAVNKGMRMATADIVAYLNTDDFYLPQTLARVLQVFAKRPDVSMVYGHWMSWHPETNFLEILPVFRYSAADMAVFAVLPQPSVFFRRTVFETLGGFDLSYTLLADNDYFSKAAVVGFNCIRVDDYLSVQTVHSGNLLAGNSSAIQKAQNEALRYRHARRQEMAGSKSNYDSGVYLAVASVKNKLLPIAWRLHLISRLCLSAIHGSAEYRLGLWSNFGVKFSLPRLARYLFGRGSRHRYAFFMVKTTAFASFLGFPPPDLGAAPIVRRRS